MAGRAREYGVRDVFPAAVRPLGDDEDDEPLDSRDEREEEREKIVYFDLDDGGRRQALLLSPPLRPKKTKLCATRAQSGKKGNEEAATELSKRILDRPKDLFHRHTVANDALSAETMDDVNEEGDGDEDYNDDDDDDGANPFASLLQATPTKPDASERRETLARRSPGRGPVAKRVTPPRHSVVVVVNSPVSRKKAPVASKSRVVTSARKLGPTFEAADARPSRWARNASTTGTAKKRQATSTASFSQARQLDSTKRRKSLPVSLDTPPTQEASGRRRLSDVLYKATVLSQQRAADTSQTMLEDSALDTSVAEEDGITDTVTHMREEPFQTQFFSPSKLNPPNRKPKSDGLNIKIRGEIGDIIRKAVRKSRRDLTILRAVGQTMLQQEEDEGVASIHSRRHVIVCLQRLRPHTSLVKYDGQVLERSPECDESTLGTNQDSMVIVFTPQIAQQHHLSPGTRLKIFAPFQFINEHAVPGQRQRSKPYLLGTNLFEILVS
ncbi:hypothetical protein Poli38472_011393 [Pythium oligandrum]|uniref:Uncharacterized protein n=1 Tax=Pythium oligandrum TaxID=41045 RepID=A0A8K1FNC5_PYTOL|nr:hypothetical protein Poli38472_011393 [Pythium oligandrum]|eukprot:TMW64513.1 hypothetical protein Poli38472_011393 [Pythium oligandrum]